AALYAYNAAPRSFTDQWSESGLAKHVRKDVAVGGRVLIEQRHHRTDEYRIRIGVGFVVCARVVEAQHFSSQSLDQHARNVAAAICAHIYDQSLLANLRVVPLDKLANTGGSHIGNVNVANAPSGRLIHFAPVPIDPIQINQI